MSTHEQNACVPTTWAPTSATTTEEPIMYSYEQALARDRMHERQREALLFSRAHRLHRARRAARRAERATRRAARLSASVF